MRSFLALPCVLAVVVPSGHTAQAQEQDGLLRARELVRQLGGLREDFTDQEFTDRAVLKELLALDWEAIAPLQDVLASSSDWSARATAAYLLTGLGATDGFYGTWQEEADARVKVFLFRGTERYVTSGTPLLNEIDAAPGMSSARRGHLQELSERQVLLSEAQMELRLRRLVACLSLPRDPNRSSSMPALTSRAVDLLSRAGCPALTPLVDAAYTAGSTAILGRVLLTISGVLGRIDTRNEVQLADVRPQLEKLIALADFCARHSEAAVRDKSCEFLFALEVVLEAAGEDTTRLLQILKELSASDVDEAVRKAATNWLVRWSDHVQEQKKPVRIDDPPVVPARNAVGVDKRTASLPSHNRDGNGPASPRVSQVTVIGAVIAITLLGLLILRIVRRPV